MRKSIAKFVVPVVAIAAIAVGCTDQVTQPDTAGMMPIDTLLARAPIDTFYSQRAPIDTLTAMPIDTLY